MTKQEELEARWVAKFDDKSAADVKDTIKSVEATIRKLELEPKEIELCEVQFSHHTLARDIAYHIGVVGHFIEAGYDVRYRIELTRHYSPVCSRYDVYYKNFVFFIEKIGPNNPEERRPEKADADFIRRTWVEETSNLKEFDAELRAKLDALRAESKRVSNDTPPASEIEANAPAPKSLFTKLKDTFK